MKNLTATEIREREKAWAHKHRPAQDELLERILNTMLELVRKHCGETKEPERAPEEERSSEGTLGPEVSPTGGRALQTRTVEV